MRRVAGPLAVVALWAILAHAQTPTPTPAPNQQVFRAGTDVVTVNVSVRASGAPVGNLRAADFVLLDNGVPQRIESVELDAVPADVTVLVETSDAVSEYVGSVSNQVQKIAALVRPDDRLSVMTIDTYVTEVLPRQPVLNPQIGGFTPGGLSSANDALALAMLRHADPDRPHLIVAITNAIDTMSALDVDTVREIARESPAILHVALIDLGEEFPDPPAKPYLKSSWQRLNDFRCSNSLQCTLTRQPWRARDDRPFGIFHYEDFDPLKDAAELTGGGMYLPGVFTDRTAAAIFEKVFADYRQGYLLQYRPRGVKPEGWHEISVTVPSAPSSTVHARRGYGVDARPADANATTTGQTASTRAANPNTSPALNVLVETYGRGDYAAARRALGATADRAKVIRDFRAGGNPWPGNPRREAVFALELAEAGLVAHRDDARLAARDLLVSYAKLVRQPFTPDEFERNWLWAEIALLEGVLQPGATEAVVANALKRFPDEPRFLLARAVAADQRASFTPTSPAARAVTAPAIDVGDAYDAAIAHTATAAEARIRKAGYLHRIGQNASALSLLDAATGRSPEAGLRYLRELFRGHVLSSLGQSDAAIVAYRAAHGIFPGAQSANVALMNVLFTHGDRREAEALSEAIQAAARDTADPWWSYWQGDYRFYPVVIGRLRGYVQ